MNALLALAIEDRDRVEVSDTDLDLGEVDLMQGMAVHRNWLRGVDKAEVRRQVEHLETFTLESLREAGLDEHWLPHLILEALLSRSNKDLKLPDERRRENPYYADMFRAWQAENLEAYFTALQKAILHRPEEEAHGK